MRKDFCIALLFFSCIAWQVEQKRDFEGEIYSLIGKGSTGEALDVLESWKASDGEGDPQYWVAGANIWFKIAVKPRLEISPLPPGQYRIGAADDKEIIIEDPETGGKVGRITDGPPIVDQEEMKKTFAFLDEGIRRNPHRLDIFTGRAHLYRTIGDLKGEIAALESLVKDPKPVNGHFETGPGKRLKGELEEYKLNMLVSYAREHIAKQNKKNDEAAKAVAELILAMFPKRPHGYNIMAALASYQAKWADSEKWLLLALKQDPDDSLVISNLGYCYETMGDIQSAAEQYRQVIKLNNNPKLVKNAKAKLTQFSQAGPDPAD